jgi:hypothetical protein
MKKYKFSLKDECMQEYTGYHPFLVVAKKEIPVPKKFLSEFENDKVYDESEFEIKQEQKLNHGENIKSGGFENGSQIYFEMVAVPKQKVADTEPWNDFFNKCYKKFQATNDSEAFYNDIKSFHKIVTSKQETEDTELWKDIFLFIEAHIKDMTYGELMKYFQKYYHITKKYDQTI